ncbi:hypothetical protein D915_010169 [Fasciola hepatica]|uniref:Uncharacterized protein n=1 Tax=Fasciola hepatica TaxID=6192 RepID=A0A4E0RAM3_FASHE|nr:hypothetical protein D915_010169 [Fasciola hepatica]
MIVHKSPGSSSSSELSKVILPTCIPYGHSSTKWLLNTFRNSANKRLLAMVKERPHMFRHTFQIFDRPSEVMADPTDTKPLFNNMAVLYLKPLSLAIYMRCRSAVEILLESTLCNPMECSYASDVHVQVQGHSGGDLLELLPACIAVRRQFLEVLPILFQSTAVSRCAPCSPRTSFALNYCMDLLVRYSHFQPDAPFGTSESLSTFTMTFNKVQESWAKLTGWIKDCYICVTLLFQLYAVLLIKAKSNAIGHAGNLLFRVLIEINCFDVVNTMAVDDFAKTLDFILKQDVVGRKLQQDRKTLSPQRSRATGERGDCRGAFFSFLRSQDSLILVLDKLKARFKLAQLRRMHILCLARSNRLGFDGNHVPRRYAVTRYDPITSGRSMAYTLRHQCMGDLHRYGKFEKQSSASLVTESDPRGGSSNTTNPRNNALKYMNKSELSDCHVHLGVPSINPTVRDRSVIPNITTQNGNETEDAKCEDLDDRSPDSENDKSGPPSRIFPPMMHINGESECHSGMRPCHMTSEFDPNGSNIPCRPNSFTKPYSEIIRSVNEEAPHRFEESRRGDEKPRSYSTVRKIRGTEEIFNVSVFPKLRNENLSLRDVDQLIDCITTSALANEQDLESQLIEDFFRDYIDRCPTDFAGTSRAESPLETQTCSDGHITASSVPLGQWPSPIMGNCVSPQRSADCITSMRTCGRPHSIDPKEGLPDSFKGSECLCTRSVNTNSQMPQDLETDGLNATSYRNFLWSCARPICHVNHAIETFKQKAATKRVTAHADTKTISPEELPKPYA